MSLPALRLIREEPGQVLWLARAVGHGGGEHVLALPAGVVQRLVAAGQFVHAGRFGVVAALPGGSGLGGWSASARA